jgi:hypothetical protein
VLTFIGFLGNRSIDGWLFDWASGLVTVTLGLLLLVTMPIMPFTEQYARERVPREYWGRPTFKKINRVLSLAWAAAIVIIGLASMAVAVLDERAGSMSDTNLLDLILNWVVPIAILVFMVRFTGIYPDRARKAAGLAEEPQPQPMDAPRPAYSMSWHRHPPLRLDRLPRHPPWPCFERRLCFQPSGHRLSTHGSSGYRKGWVYETLSVDSVRTRDMSASPAAPSMSMIGTTMRAACREVVSASAPTVTGASTSTPPK